MCNLHPNLQIGSWRPTCHCVLWAVTTGSWSPGTGRRHLIKIWHCVYMSLGVQILPGQDVLSVWLYQPHTEHPGGVNQMHRLAWEATLSPALCTRQSSAQPRPACSFSPRGWCLHVPQPPHLHSHRKAPQECSETTWHKGRHMLTSRQHSTISVMDPLQRICYSPAFSDAMAGEGRFFSLDSA